MARSLLGEEHQFVSECAMGYASALRDLGRFEEAESLLQSLLPRVGKKFGPSSRVRLLQMLAALHVAKGDLAAAERSMIEAIRLACDHLAEDFPSEATRLQRLVTRFDDHRQLTPKDFADAFTIIADIARAPVNGVSDMVLASDLLDQRGDREGAELLLRRAIQVVGSGGPGLRRVVAEPSIRLARLLTSDGRFEEAEQILLEVYPSLSMWSGDGTPRVRKAAQALVELYEAKGKPADAEPYRRAAGRSVESP
jgi:tetratricopeptide (TPR) repeat protein